MTDASAGVRRDIAHAGGRALAQRIDVVDAGAVMRAADETVEAFDTIDTIDVWVAVAMVTIYVHAACRPRVIWPQSGLV